MSFARGRPLVMTPGPSVVPDEVLEAMRRPMPNIYEGEIVDLIYRVLDQLPAIARTQHRAYVALSNGHGAWEMAITNTLSRGDHVLVLEVGRFASGWADYASTSGITFEVITAQTGAAIDPDEVRERLAADKDRTIKAVLVAQVDTASSVHNDIKAIRDAMNAADHPALLMVDCVASLGCEPFEMDAWDVDVTVAAVQKGLMMPPGLGLVWAGPRAKEAHKTADLRTGYWDWTRRTDPDEHYWIFAGTPPVHQLYGLEVALRLLNEEGLEAVWERHRVLSQAVHAAVDAWHKPDGLQLHVPKPADRAASVTMVETGELDANDLRRSAELQTGLTLGLGIHGDRAHQFRIAHMGYMNPTMLLGALGALEATLIASGAPIGASGVAAATESMASAMKLAAQTRSAADSDDIHNATASGAFDSAMKSMNKVQSDDLADAGGCGCGAGTCCP